MRKIQVSNSFPAVSRLITKCAQPAPLRVAGLRDIFVTGNIRFDRLIMPKHYSSSISDNRVGIDVSRPLHRRWALRAFDLLFSVIGLVIGLPIFIIICIIGLIDSGSPLFFQQRVGKDKQPFTLVKFRTMKKDTASVGTHNVDFTAITGIGNVLRRTKLDELPQLINVLLGHMSFVGPRPCLPTQRKLVAEREKRGIYSVRPGITGLAQINEVDMSTPRKLARYDDLMIRNMSPRTYFYFILATALGKGSGDRVKKGS